MPLTIAANGNASASEREVEAIPSSESARLLKRPPQNAGSETNQTVDNVLQIPQEMLESVRSTLHEFIRTEVRLCEQERAELIDRVARWKEVYMAPPADEPKHFPIFNSSNLTIPVVKEIVNTICAQIVQATLTAKPFWVLKDLAAEWEPFVDDVERFLDVAAKRDIHLDDAAIEWLIEGVKMGTSIMEVGHEVDVRNNYRYTADGKSVYKDKIVMRDGVVTKNVGIENFWIRAHETDIQLAEWCGRMLWLSEHDLKVAESQKKMFGVEHVISRAAGRKGSEPQEKMNEIQKLNTSRKNLHRVLVMYISFDVDGDGRKEQLKVYYAVDADFILSVQFHPYWHGKRPFVKFTYFPIEGRFYGDGLCSMLEDIQLGISDKHNKRADNETMANLKMFLKRKMVTGLMPGDPLYTGKIIEVNDIWNDLRELQMAEIYPSTIQEEQILRQYANSLSGHGEAQAGSAMPVTRTTAAAQIALLQEQSKRIDLTVRSARTGLGEVGWHAIMLYYQFGTNGKAVAWMGQKGLLVDGVFKLPRRVLELGSAISVNTPTSLQNRQVKRENALALFNLMVQLYQQMLPFVQHLAPERMPEVAHAMARGANRFMEDVLETFEVNDPEDLLAGITLLQKVLPAPEDLGGLESFRRGEESAAITDQLRRLEDLLSEADASRTRGEGVSDRSRAPRRLETSQGVRGGNLPSFQLGGEPLNR